MAHMIFLIVFIAVSIVSLSFVADLKMDIDWATAAAVSLGHLYAAYGLAFLLSSLPAVSKGRVIREVLDNHPNGRFVAAENGSATSNSKRSDVPDTSNRNVGTSTRQISDRQSLPMCGLSVVTSMSDDSGGLDRGDIGNRYPGPVHLLRSRRPADHRIFCRRAVLDAEGWPVV